MSFPIEGPPVPAWIGIVLTAGLAVACAADLRVRRVPNPLVLTILLVGLAIQAFRSGGAGLVAGVGGMVTGLLIWMPFWLLGMMGGGDVKLAAAGAAWLGVLPAVEASLLAGLCGGLLALLWLLWFRGVRYTAMRLTQGVHRPAALRETSASPRDRQLPYALAISAGLLLEVWVPGLLLGGGR